KDQLEIDMINFSGKTFRYVDNRLMSLQLIKKGMTEAVMFGPDGRTWLNNNLGADYANVNSPHFNPTQQATSKTDYKAYGSLFQWGREANGHELVDWTSFGSGRVVHSNLSWSRDMSSSLTTYHDPCPNGYHTPSKSEWEQLFSKVGSGNSNMWKERQLNLPAAGYRY
ncbi:hypothetical protein ACQ1PW_11595, partial [Ornithobacterium rhinotracheale]